MSKYTLKCISWDRINMRFMVTGGEGQQPRHHRRADRRMALAGALPGAERPT
jgi:hypothetical protein